MVLLDRPRVDKVLTSVVSLSEETVDTTDGELETGLGGSRGRLGSGTFAGLSFATFARHCKSELVGWLVGGGRGGESSEMRMDRVRL